MIYFICNGGVVISSQWNLYTTSWWYDVNCAMGRYNCVTQTLISRVIHWLMLMLVRPRRVSEPMIVQCFASRNANIWNVSTHLSSSNGNVNISGWVFSSIISSTVALIQYYNHFSEWYHLNYVRRKPIFDVCDWDSCLQIRVHNGNFLSNQNICCGYIWASKTQI